MPILLEYISDQYNTYLLVGIDSAKTKKLYICNRNFAILDQVDLGTNTRAKINHLLFKRAFNKSTVPSVTGILKYDKETYLFEIELMMSDSISHLFELKEKDKISVDTANHINYVFNNYSIDNKCISYNFSKIEKITTIINKPYFIVNNTLYHYTNELITKVRDWTMDPYKIEIIELPNDCYAFYKDNDYVFTHSLLNNRKEEIFYDKMLKSAKKPIAVYFDKNSSDVLIYDLTSVYTLCYTKDKKTICHTLNPFDLELDTINLYKNGSDIFIYDHNNFYSYNELMKEWMLSEFNSGDDMHIFCMDNTILLYSDNQAFQYNKDTYELMKLPFPKDISEYHKYRVNHGKLMINDHFYNTYSKTYIPIHLIQPKIFEGEINGNYYHHVINNEMCRDSSNIVFYITPYIQYYFNAQEVKLIDYSIKNGIPYMLEYKTNHLYKIEDNKLVKVFEKSIRAYDISNNYLAYTSYMPHEQLYLYDIDNDYEELVYDAPVEDIYIDKYNIYFCDLNDSNLYRYHIKTKETIKLTDTGDIQSMYVIKDRIIYQTKDKIYWMDKTNFEIKDALEGHIIAANEKDNELIYYCSRIALLYNLDTMKNEVISYDNTFYTIYDLLDDKAVVLCKDGPGALFVSDYRVLMILK